MDKLKTATYVAVLIASIMFIFPLAINTSQAKPCDLVKNMATVNVNLALDNEASSNYYIQRAEGYSSYYSAFCKP
tara:strand:- start:26 stop:250 length:225 start_codon:yes stop_codon:yes gene_type:complete